MDASVICAKIAPMKTALATLALLLLCACQPRGADQSAAPPAAAAPATVIDVSRPITARGTEPFWALTIDGTAFRLIRPGRPDLIAEAPGAAISNGRAIWIAKAADGQQMTVTLYLGDCSDGMSDIGYPMSAEVALLNEAFRGCAGPTADTPQGG
ncbi:MAG TPA: hypothetical protein VF474_02360 [Phenylobacterium sp.]